MSSEAIGMMDQAYFVGKAVIINWLNDQLTVSQFVESDGGLCVQLNIAKIEECATAAVYCAVMDCLYPDTFPFHRVKWQAKHEHEFVENYKVLQAAFDKNQIKKHIDVAKLVKGKYQDDLEFC